MWRKCVNCHMFFLLCVNNTKSVGDYPVIRGGGGGGGV